MTIEPTKSGVVIIDDDYYIIITSVQLEGMTVNGLIARLQSHMVQGGSDNKKKGKYGL